MTQTSFCLPAYACVLAALAASCSSSNDPGLALPGGGSSSTPSGSQADGSTSPNGGTTPDSSAPSGSQTDGSTSTPDAGPSSKDAGSGDAASTRCSAATPLVGCTLYGTVGELETKLFAVVGRQNVPGCSGNACHVPGNFGPDLTSPNAFARLLDVPQGAATHETVCSPPLKYIDSADPANSLLSISVHLGISGVLDCPGSNTFMVQGMPRNLPQLSNAQLACVDAYVTSLVGCK